jgi:O-acetylhomoserine/O-acetylserine sulfhydrylase-like pyridoxal-dependent enzyme
MERRNAHPRQHHDSAGLIRMSIGCEDAPDIRADLKQAL